MDEMSLVRASLVAGLELWGIGGCFLSEYSSKQDYTNIDKLAERYDLDLAKYERLPLPSSGLCWADDPDFRHETLSERIKEQLENGWGDITEEAINEAGEMVWWLFDYEYVFTPEGKGLHEEDNILAKEYRWKDGKVYSYCGEGSAIHITEIDVETLEEVKAKLLGLKGGGAK